MEAKVFPRKIEFYHFIKSVADKFDLKKSLQATENSFVTTDGKHVNSFHFTNFLANLNKEVGTKFSPQHSRQTPAGYVIVVDDSVADEEKQEVNEQKEEQPVEQPEQVVEQEEEEVPEISVDDKDAVIAEAKALYDENAKKESKDKLAEFAQTKGVTLMKNQTFEDMIEQLKNSIV